MREMWYLMKALIWDDSMTTGVPEIDNQHQELIEKFNELRVALEQKKGREAIGDILGFLQFYAAWHFGREEECMEKYRCPVAVANKQAHAGFVSRFNQLYEDWNEAGAGNEMVIAVYAELGHWFVGHIQKTDTQLYPCVLSAARPDD